MGPHRTVRHGQITETMGFYRRSIVPKLCHMAMRSARLRPYRARTVGAAEGRVLEIGAGSGLNLPLYRACVQEIIALEPDPVLVRLAERHNADAEQHVRYLQASAESIPLDAHSVDCVVTTWTLCSIGDVTKALGEVRRVLAPHGKLLFVEHGLAPEPRIEWWQHRLTPVWKTFSGGCHLDRCIAALISASGFKIDRLETAYMPGPRVLTYFYEGSAQVG